MTLKEWHYGMLDNEARTCWFSSDRMPKSPDEDSRTWSTLYAVVNKFYIDGNGPFILPEKATLVLHLDPEDKLIDSFEIIRG